jgi:hypothetical protein
MTITSVTTSTTSQYTIGSGNELLVANGGSVTAAIIQTGGQLVVSGGVDSNATVAAGATETVSTGSASGDLIYGALANVSGVAGRLTNEVIESGGTFNETNSAVVVGTEVLSGGTFILSGNTSGGNSNTTLVGGGVVELITAKSTLGGTLTFSGGGNTLETSATISAGYGDEAVISGFSSSDKIDIDHLHEQHPGPGGRFQRSRRDRVCVQQRARRQHDIRHHPDRARRLYRDGGQYAPGPERRQHLGCDDRQRRFSHRQWRCRRGGDHFGGRRGDGVGRLGQQRRHLGRPAHRRRRGHQ